MKSCAEKQFAYDVKNPLDFADTYCKDVIVKSGNYSQTISYSIPAKLLHMGKIYIADANV